MGLNNLRQLFIDFFKEKSHIYLKSFPLIPVDDASLLFINSGMAPMKKWFLGQENPPKNRVVTVQKCIRTSDLENVGKTDRHGTFFEMLGNFSFGDYFKKEAIFWAWEFVVDVLKMPQDRLYVTVYEKDYEAYNIWKDCIGLPPSKIYKLGKDDNFWEIGLGPCGPCSEIYFDRGLEHGCKKEACGPGCDCDRFIEFWNLVFSQYNNKGNFQYEDMAHKNIDTGMGLERLACIFQGVDNLFEVDTVKVILDKVCSLAGIAYKKNKEKDVLVRIITDHIRSIVFLISDGVVPSNEGRGYVLRRLIRRAKNSGERLGIKSLFFKDLVDVVVNQNKEFYEKLYSDAEYIKNVVQNEEINFEKILKIGAEKACQLFNSLSANVKYENVFNNIFSKVEEAFKNFKVSADELFESLDSKIDRNTLASLSNVEEIKTIEQYFRKFEDLNNIYFEIGIRNVYDISQLEGFVGEIKNLINILRKSGFSEDDLEQIRNELKDFSNRCRLIVNTTIDNFKCYFDRWACNNDELAVRCKSSAQKACDLESGGNMAVVIKIYKVFYGNIPYNSNENALQICAEDAFKLCDTFGLPFDILKDMATRRGFEIDEQGFLKLMNDQKKRAKEAAHFADNAWVNEKNYILEKFEKTEFVGYETIQCVSKLLCIFSNGEVVDSIASPAAADLIFDKTPFYATGGGQVCDTGDILSVDGDEIIANVSACVNSNSLFIHSVNVLKGNVKVGDTVILKVNLKRRMLISKNHTAAHLLQKALKELYGSHIRQAGQLIDDRRLRFDFNNFEAMKPEEIKTLQDRINNIIVQDLVVRTYEMEKEKAKSMGAVALFNEKYKDIVRVVDVSGYSVELCGGTHVKKTGDIGVFKILSEASVGSGVRRIEAITSLEVLNFANKLEEAVSSICGIFKTNDYFNVADRVRDLVSKLDSKTKSLDELKLKICEDEFLKTIESNLKTEGVFKLAVFKNNTLNKKQLRVFADYIKQKSANLITLIFSLYDNKYNILVVCAADAVKNGADANNIIKRLSAIVGGKGGGRKDFATAGVLNFDMAKEIEAEFFNIFRNF